MSTTALHNKPIVQQFIPLSSLVYASWFCWFNHSQFSIAHKPMTHPLQVVIKSLSYHQLEELKTHDLIEDSASPVVMVKKKDGTYRFCVDFRKLNLVSITDAHHLPRVNDSSLCFSSPSRCQVDTGMLKWILLTDQKQYLQQVTVSTNSKWCPWVWG